MLKYLLLFTLIPLAEIWILIELGGWIGTWPTILLIASTGFLGVLLAKSQGLAVLYNIQRSMAEGLPPAEPLFDGACILVGGALLLTPGLLTDLFGFSLLLPFTRSLYKNTAYNILQRRMREGHMHIWHSNN